MEISVWGKYICSKKSETVCLGQPENLQNCLSKHKVNIFQVMFADLDLHPLHLVEYGPLRGVVLLVLIDDLMQLLHVNDCRACIAGLHQVNALFLKTEFNTAINVEINGVIISQTSV